MKKYSNAEELEKDPGYKVLPLSERNAVRKHYGFPVYGEENLEKVNDLRRMASGVGLRTVPILDEGSVLFSPASDTGGKPRSCYNCPKFAIEAQRCSIIGPDVIIRKLIHGSIEYWPACGEWGFGKPYPGMPKYTEKNDPGNLGLIWINAPEVGLPLSGSNCGGQMGGDDCDYYITTKDDKRACPTGFCRVLQKDVENGACCAAWTDDDRIDWRVAQDWLKPGGLPKPPKG